jgi:hypothetical protein
MVRQHEDDAAVAVWSAGVDTRLRKERRGRRIARARAREGGREGKEKGARRRRAPFIGDTVRGWGQAMGGTTWRQGRGGGASAVVGRCGVADSGPAAALTGGAREGGV